MNSSIIFNIMSVPPKKIKNQSFNEYKSFLNLYSHTPKIVQSFFQPFNALAAKPALAVPGQPQSDDQFYLKFSNDFVLNAFLYYLGGGELKGLQLVPHDDEVSLESVVEHAQAFKNFYQANNKNVEGLTAQAIDPVIGRLGQRYLFFNGITKAYDDGQEIQENYSKIMLLVIKLNGNIIFGALKRTPPQRPPFVIQKPEFDPDVVRQEQKPMANCLGYSFLFLLAALFSIILISSVFNVEQVRTLNPLYLFNVLK